MANNKCSPYYIIPVIIHGVAGLLLLLTGWVGRGLLVGLYAVNFASEELFGGGITYDPLDLLTDCDHVSSPLVLDLDGDGVEAGALACFDHAGDGWNELSRWAGEDDGVLVWDRNGDGVINNGSELFGNNMVVRGGATAANGFAALAGLDSNGDGVVNASDTNWANLRVMRWRDANDDGIVQDGEKTLVTLGSLGIASLNTRYTNSSRVDGFGNEHRQVGSYTKKDGTTAKMTDVWFATNPALTTYSRAGLPAQSAAIKALPDVTGSGVVYDLRDAMALDDADGADGNSRLTAPFYAGTRTETRSLREMVAAFVAKNADGAPALDKAARGALAEKILLRWAGAEGAVKGDYLGSPGFGTTGMSYADARQIAVVEAFQGGQWREGLPYRNPAYTTGQKVQRIYMSRLERLYGQLMLGSHLRDLHGKITVQLKSGAAAGSTDIADYEMNFGAAAAALSGSGNAARRSEFLRSLAAVYGGGEEVVSAMKKTAAAWVYEYKYYAEYYERGVFGGLRTRSNDFVGDCGCSGGARDNVFRTTGGTADQLQGRGGDDVYQLDYGTGHDRVEEQWRDSDYAGDAGDVIKLAPGIGADKVKLARTRDDLVVSLYDAAGRVDSSLTVVGHYSNPVARVEKVMFGDGTVWNADDIIAVVRASGRGSVGADTYDGGADGVSGVLQGGKGADVYLLGRGSGKDIVDESAYNSTSGGENDVVRLKKGLTAADARLSRNKYDLIIGLQNNAGTATDALTVRGYYVNDAAKIERVELHDGTLVWGVADFAGVSWMAPRYKSGTEISGTGRNDYLHGRGDTNDVFDGDAGGDDWLFGKAGDDVYWLGRGTGNDMVSEHSSNTARGDTGDVIKLKPGIVASSVRLLRTNNGADLVVQLLDGKGAVSDSLTVKSHYNQASAKVERVEFADGTVWDANDFMSARIRGGARNDYLHGLGDTNDVFDGDAGGNDWLFGKAGDDVYWLGRGTGKDVINEHNSNTAAGDAGDAIKVKSGISASSVRLARSGNNLVVRIVDAAGAATDSLTVLSHFSTAAAKVERVEAGGKVLLESQYQNLINEVAAFTAGNSKFASEAAVYNRYWTDETALTAPSA